MYLEGGLHVWDSDDHDDDDDWRKTRLIVYTLDARSTFDVCVCTAYMYVCIIDSCRRDFSFGY